MNTTDARHRRIVRAAGLVLVLTLVARIAGFVRYLVFGGSVGGGDIGTTYATINLLPNVLFEILAGGALAAITVPLLSGLMDRPGGRALTHQIMASLVTWALLLTVPVAAFVALCAPQLSVLILSSSAEAAMVDIGTWFLRIFAVQIPLYAITVILSAYLQSRHRFGWPAALPLVSSLVVMASYGLYAVLVPSSTTAATLDSTGLWVLGGGTSAGVLAMATVAGVAALKAGWRPAIRVRMPNTYAQQAVRLGAAGVGTVLAQQAVIALIMLLAMRLGGTGTLVLFQYAQAVYLLPYAVLVVPLITTTFPQLSELRLFADTVEFARVATRSLRLIIALSLLGSTALIAAAPAVDQFFFQLDRSAVKGVGPSLAGLGLGLGGYAISSYGARVLAAALRTRDSLLVGSVGWVAAGAFIVLISFLSPQRHPAEAATTFALAIAFGMGVAGVVTLTRLEPLLSPGGEYRSLRRLALAGPAVLAVGTVPAHIVIRSILDADSGMAGVIAVGILAGVIAVAMAGVLLLLVDRQLSTIAEGYVRRRPRKRAPQ